jgi:hypothetical protein
MDEQTYREAVQRVVNYLLLVSSWCGDTAVGKMHYDLSEAASIGTMRQVFIEKEPAVIERDIRVEMKRKKEKFN